MSCQSVCTFLQPNYPRAAIRRFVYARLGSPALLLASMQLVWQLRDRGDRMG